MEHRTSRRPEGRQPGQTGKRYAATANTFARERDHALYDSLEADAWLPAMYAQGILAGEEADPNMPPIPVRFDEPEPPD